MEGGLRHVRQYALKDICDESAVQYGRDCYCVGIPVDSVRVRCDMCD